MDELIDEMKKRLLAKQAELRRELGQDVVSCRQIGEACIETRDAIDLIPLGEEREIVHHRGNSHSIILRMVDEALVRINVGSYGICLNCGEEIPASRLNAVPWARFCAACQARLERKSGQQEVARSAPISF
ncbi:MAG: TraR/DksA family transcriptional regulator [Deltaproteobacteria bacterium]|nr:TraR/DksA family transcriptional regulator [Deltaproteobacteria bacterium]